MFQTEELRVLMRSQKEITKQSGNIFVGSRGTSQISVLIVLESQLGGLPARPIDIM
jgi:hypothetical protein